ncbi:MAG: GlsB/YeaQ/YmgE family stress response membrane protein [Candidatus Solibacter sp.]
MHLIWTLFIGLIAGALAKLLTPGRDPGGFFVTICIGIAGSLLATFLGRAAGWYGPDASAGFLASVVGAILLLAIYHMIIGRRRVV